MKLISKNYSILRIAFITAIAVCCLANTSFAQKSSKKADKEAKIKALIESNRYAFYVQSATPMSGRTVNVDPGYDVKVTPDTVITYLPYYGRAYTAPIDPTEGGIKINTTDFKYEANPGKKGGWEIKITPNNNDVESLFFSISSEGYASLVVNSFSKSSISYYGYVSDIKTSKKKK